VPLMTALRLIAKNRNLDNPDLAVKLLLRKLVSTIKHHRYEIFRDWYYDLLIEPQMAQAATPLPWICYLVRWKNNMQSVGRRRGSQPLDRARCIKEAASITTIDELTPVERRAVDLIMGGRPNARKSVIEKRAIRLAKIVQAEWFPRQKQSPRQGANRLARDDFRKDQYGLPIFGEGSLPLTTVDVISIATSLNLQKMTENSALLSTR
jgi:hypothetical protein